MKTVFINGSPKKKLSVSSYLLGVVRFLVRGEVVSEQVRNSGDHERVLNSIGDAENVVFGMPLYVDGVPSHVLAFMKEMENFCKRCNFQWCGGIGIGGGVMLNVMRIMFFVYAGLFVLNTVMSGLSVALPIFAEQLIVVLFFSLGAFFYCLRMGRAINKGAVFGVKFTRVLLPSFLFILVADFFFVIISVVQGGIFKGWLSRKL